MFLEFFDHVNTIEYVEILLNTTYQVSTLTFFTHLITLCQPISTAVNGGADAIQKGHLWTL